MMSRIINRWSDQLTLRWIMIYWIWFLCNFTPIIQAKCPNHCNLKILDEDKTYIEFKKLSMSDSVRVIFFNIHIRNQSLNQNFNQGDDATLYFAWIKNSFGRAIITLPTSFIAMSLSLYSIFIDTLKTNLTDSNQDCYKNYFNDDYCGKQRIFKVLIDITRSNHSCSDKYCATICQRNFHLNDGYFKRKVDAQCCQKDILNPQINITSCFTKAEGRSFYVPLSMFLTIILSIYLAGIAFNMIVNWFLTSAQR